MSAHAIGANTERFCARCMRETVHVFEADGWHCDVADCGAVTADGAGENASARNVTPTEEKTQWSAEAWPTFRDESPSEPIWIVDGLVPAGALAFVAGPPKKGKTWLGLALALAAATGKALLGEYAVSEPRNVLYIALEGSRAGIRTRIGALARGLELDPDGDDLDRLHVLYRPRPFNLVDPRTAGWLYEQVEAVDAALVIVDVLRAAARFRENVSEDFALVRDALAPILAVERTVVVLHHFGKLTETQKERSPGERMAGTGAMYGALDVGFLITRSENGARRLRVDIEARDFAAPDALGVVIEGDGSGEHGGFTYVDSATLVIDETAAEDRDLASETEELFADDDWRTATEIAGKQTARKRDGQTVMIRGIGARKDDVLAALDEATPGRFVQVDGPRVGRHTNAKPWGTAAMLSALDESVFPAAGTDETDPQLDLSETSSETCVPPVGGKTRRHTFSDDDMSGPGAPGQTSRIDSEDAS